MHTIKMFFANSSYFKNDADQEIFFNATDLWEMVVQKMIKAIRRYTPRLEKHVRKNAKLFEMKKVKIIDHYIANYDLLQPGDSASDQKKYCEMLTILHINCIFVIDLHL